MSARAEPDHGLRRLFHTHLPRMHWTGIELGLMAAGVPDSNYCWEGVEGWLEYKWTSTHAVGLESHQVGWILRRMRAGGRVHIVTWRQTEGGARRGAAESELWLHEGWDAAELRADGLLAAPPTMMVEVCPTRPGSWPWEDIGRHLTDWPMSRR